MKLSVTQGRRGNCVGTWEPSSQQDLGLAVGKQLRLPFLPNFRDFWLDFANFWKFKLKFSIFLPILGGNCPIYVNFRRFFSILGKFRRNFISRVFIVGIGSKQVYNYFQVCRTFQNPYYLPFNNVYVYVYVYVYFRTIKNTIHRKLSEKYIANQPNFNYIELS